MTVSCDRCEGTNVETRPLGTAIRNHPNAPRGTRFRCRGCDQVWYEHDQVEVDDRTPHVIVPHEYVLDINTIILIKLKKMGFGDRFTVMQMKHEATVRIAFQRLIAGSGYFIQDTDCVPAWMNNRHPEDVAEDAVLAFLAKLKEVGAK